MKRIALILAVLTAPLASHAHTRAEIIEDVVSAHILPRFETLAAQAGQLAATAATHCDPADEDLRTAYGRAFDAWVSASHLRFGPSEVDDRAFALAFWPDSRGATPRTLNALLTQKDPIARSVEAYAEVSIAARGFYALEFLLYDEGLMQADDMAYHCLLIQTISQDIAATATGILQGWRAGYAEQLLSPTADGHYQSETEVVQELFKSLSAGLQFTEETRLGRPLGQFERPRPSRAEARRSGRSARHVALSLAALRDLAARLSAGSPDVQAELDAGFQSAVAKVSALNDPVFASVAAPQTRLKVEIVQISIGSIRDTLRERLGPTLGVAAGFNALDGD